ncbi:MAG: inositol monophosphatase [Planctomycetales bacterium]|nr:inositol monophosphatase [Planctomycetales bacterium]NIM09701.1 inositol monophosphatase [Planctomycetales bacterium]NIN09178.1 inositol monophosphatase [Planctomycetales bacterium]NIN78283.1 inositol monophosphatase [Planctomycetales bacterium]NIO35474.1 inositol monophosphatase [Planctomycetales bacterium]
MSELVNVCESLARLGGEVLRRWEGRFRVRQKGPADLVTEADCESQEAIRARLAQLYPDDLFVGEEDAGQPAWEDEAFWSAMASDRVVWIVDPLDGTTNYAHGVPHYAVSVAATRGGEVLAAAVYNPAAEECFTANTTSGPLLNGRPIRVSGVERLGDALVAGSIPPAAHRDSAEVGQLLKVIERAQSFRRSGSASLNMCYVAAGRYDAYWATETKAWDVAAGWLIVQRAGGIVRGLDGGPFQLAHPAPLVAATQPLSDEFLNLLRGHAS